MNLKTPKVLLTKQLFNDFLEFQVRRPFKEQADAFILSVQWKTAVLFRESIANGSLRRIAIGAPVIYKPQSKDSVLPALKRFRYKYLGHVKEFQSNSFAVVNCRDSQSYQVPLTDLYLEASPVVIREYENLSGARYSNQSLWHKIQELDFVLNKSGRRNPSVLKDRLQAIRQTLGGPREEVIIPMNCFQKGSLSLNLSPLNVEVRTDV